MLKINEELKNLGIKPNKNLGQNFLISKNKIKKISELISEHKSQEVLEIGPGLGALTSEIINKKKSIICIEKDKNLYEYLNIKFKENKNIKLLNEDILKTDFSQFNKRNLLIFGNLPYNISSKILNKYIDFFLNSEIDGIFMFQKEVADKILKKKTKASQLSIRSNYFFNIKEVLKLKEIDFWPPPKIKSSLLYFSPKKVSFSQNNMKNLSTFLSISFSSNRKTIINNLITKYDKKKTLKILSKLNIDPILRPEKIKPELFIKLYKELEIIDCC